MKSILIIAQDGDKTVREVIHWIKHLSENNIAVFRINDTDIVKNITVGSSQERTYFSIRLDDNREVFSPDVSAYWYRRGELAFSNVEIKDYSQIGNNIIGCQAIDKYYNEEWNHITDYIHRLLRQSNHIKSLNSYSDIETNKLINTDLAISFGLKVPETLISNDVNEIANFLYRKTKVITKPVRSSGNYFLFEKNKCLFGTGTTVFTSEDLYTALQQHTKFQPTLFQEYVEKEFEIRSFYIKGVFYSMAIFSQNHNDTKIDFRQWKGDDDPCRNIPYKLPKKIEDKLHMLMRKLNYDTGSIDIVFDGVDYIFLEVNTVGQLDWLSKHCNYYIEKAIANELIKLCHEI